MNSTIHIITKHFPPTHGGLEAWTWTLARMLADGGHKPVVYVREEVSPKAEKLAQEAGSSLVQLAPAREIFVAPLLSGHVSERIVKKEHSRIDSLTIRRHVRHWMHERAGRHALLSNFALFEGFIANSVATELGLPHVAVMAGTDFSRGIRDPQDFSTLERVVRDAKLVVTKSEEQERYLSAAFGVFHLRTIETSVDDTVANTKWNYAFAGEVPIFSDCGFTHKKGTQILVRAFQRLRTEGYPVTLTICGDLAEGQESYWRQFIEAVQAEHTGCFEYLGYVPQEDTMARLQNCAIYASATLGEGSSKSRATALCVGTPMVTTRCGEWRTEETCDGVFLAEPGDLESFETQLRIACEQTIHGTIRAPDVSHFRRRFSRECERSAWMSMMESLND